MSCGRPVSEALRRRIEAIHRLDPQLEHTLISERVGVSAETVRRVIKEMHNVKEAAQ